MLLFVRSLAAEYRRVDQRISLYRASLASKNARFMRLAAMQRKGVSAIGKVIMLALAVYIVAFVLPGALTALATTALTSVSSAVATLLQTVVSIVAVIGIVLLILNEVGISISV